MNNVLVSGVLLLFFLAAMMRLLHCLLVIRYCEREHRTGNPLFTRRTLWIDRSNSWRCGTAPVYQTPYEHRPIRHPHAQLFLWALGAAALLIALLFLLRAGPVVVPEGVEVVAGLTGVAGILYVVARRT